MSIDYYVIPATSPLHARVSENGTAVAQIRMDQNPIVLQSLNTDDKWTMSQKVDGEYRPFSMVIKKITNNDNSGLGETIVLKIRDHLFSHQGKMYMITNIPEGSALKQHHVGARYISRLDMFPFEDPSQIDLVTRSQLRRYRGLQVGEIYGVGTRGHVVKLQTELEGIGLFLAASSYLMYSTAMILQKRSG